MNGAIGVCVCVCEGEEKGELFLAKCGNGSPYIYR